MILADDNFATIVKAVVNGRSVYENIKNAIQFLLSGNAAGIFSVLYASLLALPVPFQPVHLLFINLLTDSLPAIAIGMEPARQGLLDRKPRDPKASILSRGLLTAIGIQGLLIAVVTMAGFYLGYRGGDAALASTMAFSTSDPGPAVPRLQLPGPGEPLPPGAGEQPRVRSGPSWQASPCFCWPSSPPGLKSLFLVSPAFGLAELGQVALLALTPTVLIQLYKSLRR